MRDQAAYRVKQLNYEVGNTRALWNDEGKALLKAYIEEGDLDHFLAEAELLYDPTEFKINAEREVFEGYCNDIIGLRKVCFYGDNPTYENTLKRLFHYLKWILKNPNKRSLYEGKVLLFDQPAYLSRFLQDLYDMSYCFTKEDWWKLMQWAYGEKFNPNRTLPIELDNFDWQPRLIADDKYSVNMAATDILLKFESYLTFYDDSYNDAQHINYLRSYREPLLKYVPDVFEFISPECFELKLYDRKHEDVSGQQTKFSPCQHRIVNFLKHAYYDYTDIEYRDLDALKRYKDIVASIEFRPELKELHGELKQFIEENGGNLRSARKAL